MPQQFKVGQKFEGTFTGAVREIVGIDSYNVEYELRYRDGRVTRISGPNSDSAATRLIIM